VTSFNSVALDQQWPRGLTRRENEVVLLVGTGMSNGEIAQQLGVSVGTVKIQYTAFSAKLAQDIVTPSWRRPLALIAETAALLKSAALA
jgi:DNA-binding NarL/FixJ family response regulator